MVDYQAQRAAEREAEYERCERIISAPGYFIGDDPDAEITVRDYGRAHDDDELDDDYTADMAAIDTPVPPRAATEIARGQTPHEAFLRDEHERNAKHAAAVAYERADPARAAAFEAALQIETARHERVEAEYAAAHEPERAREANEHADRLATDPEYAADAARDRELDEDFGISARERADFAGEREKHIIDGALIRVARARGDVIEAPPPRDYLHARELDADDPLRQAHERPSAYSHERFVERELAEHKHEDPEGAHAAAAHEHDPYGPQDLAEAARELAWSRVGPRVAETIVDAAAATGGVLADALAGVASDDPAREITANTPITAHTSESEIAQIDTARAEADRAEAAAADAMRDEILDRYDRDEIAAAARQELDEHEHESDDPELDDELEPEL
ncbi:MAG: hypothetical protein ACYC97_13940 [Metallibacterium sp.]